MPLCLLDAGHGAVALLDAQRLHRVDSGGCRVVDPPAVPVNSQLCHSGVSACEVVLTRRGDALYCASEFSSLLPTMRFLLVDSLLELEAGHRAVGTKTFSAAEEIFADHFPGFAVVPGTLLTEAMAQLGGWLILYTEDFRRLPLLTRIEHAEFRRLVRPGQALRLESELVRSVDETHVCQARVFAGGRRPVAEARLTYRALPRRRESAEDPLVQWARENFARLRQG